MKSVQWEIEWRTLGEMNGCILKVERVNDSEQIEMTPNIEWVLGVGNLEKSNLEGTSIYAPNSGEISHFCQRKPGICGEKPGLVDQPRKCRAYSPRRPFRTVAKRAFHPFSTVLTP